MKNSSSFNLNQKYAVVSKEDFIPKLAEVLRQQSVFEVYSFEEFLKSDHVTSDFAEKHKNTKNDNVRSLYPNERRAMVTVYQKSKSVHISTPAPDFMNFECPKYATRSELKRAGKEKIYYIDGDDFTEIFSKTVSMVSKMYEFMKMHLDL